MRRRIIIGALVACGVVAALIGFATNLGRTKPRQNIAGDMRSMATALETYYADNKSFPPMTPLSKFSTDRKALDAAGGGSLGAPFPALTTPVAYITRIFEDYFAPVSGLPFAYYTDGPGWILFSAGPDRQYDISDPAAVYREDASSDSLRSALAPYSYDATNGTVSGGDVWRVRQ